MKRFYVLLGALAVAGVALLYLAGGSHAPASVAPWPDVPPATDGFRGYTLGSDSAPVEVVEYVDFECPVCAVFATVQFPAIRDQLIASGKARWRIRDFPLPNPAHKNARFAALVAQCAGEQGKFWPMADSLFFHHDWAQTGRDVSGLFRGFAQAIGLDLAKYDACVQSQRYAGRIAASYQEGVQRGVDGTPNFFINGQRYKGSHTSDGFSAYVDSLLARRPARRG
ncbi:MAG TPA: thioredoxin domain-containing protein [Gemmatimonadales bacterium]|nr:thioredoxin domain-containing protein [Gemmatimonadales bacterium]